MSIYIPSPAIEYGCVDFVIRNQPILHKFETIEQTKLRYIFLTFIPPYWRDIINTRWVPISPDHHTCESDTDPCNMVTIRSKLFLLSGLENNLPKFHICIDGWCFRTHHPEDELHSNGKFLLDLNECHICQETGIEHFCGEFCNKFIDKSEGHTCVITGLQVMAGGLDFNPTFSAMNGNFVKNIVEDKKLSYMNKQLEEMTAQETLAMVAKESIDEQTNVEFSHKTFREQYFVDALLYVSTILNENNLYKILSQNYDIADEISQSITRYLLQHYTNKRLVSLQDLYELRLHERKKKYNFPFFTMTEKQKEGMFNNYALAILSLWYIIRTKTAAGIKYPKKFAFEEFKKIAFYFLEHGINIRCDWEASETEDARVEMYELIPPDGLLKVLPVNGRFGSKTQQQQQYNYSRKNKPQEKTGSDVTKSSQLMYNRIMKSMNTSSSNKKSRQKKITKKTNNMKNDVIKALKDAIVLEHVPPGELLLSCIDYEQMIERNFLPLSCSTKSTSDNTYTELTDRKKG